MTAEKAALGTDRPGRALNLTDLTASVHWSQETVQRLIGLHLAATGTSYSTN
jgi:hypothetical protein